LSLGYLAVSWNERFDLAGALRLYTVIREVGTHCIFINGDVGAIDADPSVSNERSVSAFREAGFNIVNRVQPVEASEPHLPAFAAPRLSLRTGSHPSKGAAQGYPGSAVRRASSTGMPIVKWYRLRNAWPRSPSTSCMGSS